MTMSRNIGNSVEFLDTRPASPVARAAVFARTVIQRLERASAVVDLVIRLWIANIFWNDGLTKIANWDTTIVLFAYEYHVPLLSPGSAALLAVATELVFPALLAAGLATRLSSAVLLVFNVIAVVSYPGLSEVGMKDHIYWGLLLLVILLHGPGKFSVDYLIRRKYMG